VSTSVQPGAAPGESHATSLPPTRVRYAVLAFAVSMAVILYLDRFAIGVAGTAIAAELNLDDAQMGWAFSAFFWVYALAQVPAGWLGDRLGGRRALALYVAAWSLAMAGLGLAYSLTALVVLRGLLGLSQAGAYATTAAFLKHWTPLTRRGFNNGAVSMGGRAGGLLASAVTPWLMVYVAKLTGQSTGAWRYVFVFYAALGLLWAAVFWRKFRNRPAEHPRCNQAECAVIVVGREKEIAAAAVAHAGLPWQTIFLNRNVLLLSLENFCVNVGWIFLATWLPTYLERVHHVSRVEAGGLSAFTALAGMAGCLSGGILTDFFLRRWGLVWGRRLPGILGCGGAALAYAVALQLHDVRVIIVVLATVYFLSDLVLGTTWSTYQDIGGPYVGTILGFANMCGNLGAAILALGIGPLAKQGDWPSVFWISSASFAVGLLCWIFIDPRIMIVKPEAEPAGQPVAI
jgi:sugar phosphate permease